MRIQPTLNLNFGYKWNVKSAFKKGKLPSVKVDASGRKLTANNATVDHIIPHSKGGRTRDNNLMIATKEFNNQRGDKPLTDYITSKGLAVYLKQFIDIKLPDFDGNEYIKAVLKTIGGLKNG